MDGLKKMNKPLKASSAVFLLGIAEVASAINQLIIQPKTNSRARIFSGNFFYCRL